MIERGLFPKSVDVNPTSKCNLNCSMCWGPDHRLADSLTTQDWLKTIDFFSKKGTDAIVFTGGEPLLRKDIGVLLRHSKELGMRVTLSTNTTLLFPEHEDILTFVDELGIPMDGSTLETNSLMREGSMDSFPYQVNALNRAKRIKPQINVTVRTVVSRKNLRDLPNIGILLEHFWGQFDRWKIYQFSPFSYGIKSSSQHAITYEEFLAESNSLRARFPLHNIHTQSSSFGEGRYVFVGSQGNIYGVGDSNTYLPIGNIVTDASQTLTRRMALVFEPSKNSVHAHNT